MSLFKKIVAAVLLLSFTVFVAFFGRLPALRYILNINLPDPRLSNFQEDSDWFTKPPRMQYTASRPWEARCYPYRREISSCISPVR